MIGSGWILGWSCELVWNPGNILTVLQKRSLSPVEGPILGQNSIEFIFHYWVHRVHTVVSIQNAQTCAQSRPIKGIWSVPLVGQLYICILYTSIYLYTVYKDGYNWSQISRVGLWWGHAVILIYSWIEGGSAYNRIGLWTSIYGNQLSRIWSLTLCTLDGSI